MPQPYKQPGAIAPIPPAWAVGMERLHPAVYRDTSGTLRISLEELFKLHVSPFCAITEQEFTAAIKHMFLEHNPSLRMTVEPHGN